MSTGFFALIVSLAMLMGAVYLKCPVTKVIDKFFKIMTTGVIFSFVLSIMLYIKSLFVPESKLAPGGNSGERLPDNFYQKQ